MVFATEQILEVADDIVAVSKPPCMPVHVAGQHRKNTVAGVLQVAAPLACALCVSLPRTPTAHLQYTNLSRRHERRQTMSPGEASRPGERLDDNDICLATACSLVMNDQCVRSIFSKYTFHNKSWIWSYEKSRCQIWPCSGHDN